MNENIVPIGVKASLIWKSPFMFIGIVFSIFSLCFSPFFFFIDYLGPLFPILGRSYTEGSVDSIEYANMESNHNKVYRIDYTYEVNGVEYKGKSYTENTNAEARSGITKVEYLKLKPSISKINNGRSAPIPLWGIAFFVFPIISIGLTIKGIFDWKKYVGIIKYGKRAMAKVLGTEFTNVRINNQPVMRVEVEFEDYQGQLHQAKFDTVNVQAVTDNPEEAIIYNSQNPSDVILLDSLGPSMKLKVLEIVTN